MFDPRQFRSALGHFATGVTIVTTRDTSGDPVGVTVNSFASVSLDPPLILWSLAKNSYSLDAFTACSHFAVHVLASSQQGLSDRFARAASDKFSGLAPESGLGDAPLLSGCATVFECSTEHRYDGGDHLILVGRVHRFDVQDRAPLLFYRGRYAAPEEETRSFAGLMRAIAPASV